LLEWFTAANLKRMVGGSHAVDWCATGVLCTVSGAAVRRRRSPGQTAQPATPCITGYVWRNAFPGDAVCVTPQTREDAAADNAAAEGRHQSGSTNCLTGFVWRAARPTDLVCVTPEIRARVAEDNTMASRRVVAQSRPVPAAPPHLRQLSR
jgi:hypothetical protein